MADTPKREIKIFYCYAREDKALRDELEKFLSGLKRRYQLRNWHDREILPGEEWEQAIDKQLNSAHLILLLISPDFMASDYIYGKEMQRALERHNKGTCRVIPILLRPTHWEEAPFSHLQLLPTNARPITRWPNLDEAFYDVVSEIGRTINHLLGSLKTKEKWIEEGNAFYALERYEEALIAFEQAIRLDPNNALLYFNRGNAFYALERYEEALTAFEQAIRLDPMYELAYENVIKLLTQMRRFEDIAVYERNLRRLRTLQEPPLAFRPSKHFQLSEVFVQSGTPEVTFVARQDFLHLKLVLEQPGRGLVIEGPSGIGKTTSVEKAIEDLKNAKVKLHLPIQERLSARNPKDRNAIQTLRNWHNGIVIIDDFHRLDVALQQEIVDYLKELADVTSKTRKLVIVGIPRTGQKLVNLSFDLATRIEIFPLAQVSEELILQMIGKGEEALNIIFERKNEIAKAANGSLYLAQSLCYYICEMAGIVETQDRITTISGEVDRAKQYVMKQLATKYDDFIKHFIAMGTARDLTGLKLLEEMAIAEEGVLSLHLLKVSKPEFSHSIERLIRECWMEKLYEACPDGDHLLFYDYAHHTLVIEDPQLAFYLKNVPFQTLAKKVGKISTVTESRVFVSYSHLDFKWLKRLQIHLKPLERAGIIDLWSDKKIGPGFQWRTTILNALETSRAAILLISANFLASDFIEEHELPTLLERAKAGGTKIIPIILSPCLFTSTGLGAYQAINTPDQPLSKMTLANQEQVFANLAQTILNLFQSE